MSRIKAAAARFTISVIVVMMLYLVCVCGFLRPPKGFHADNQSALISKAPTVSGWLHILSTSPLEFHTAIANLVSVVPEVGVVRLKPHNLSAIFNDVEKSLYGLLFGSCNVFGVKHFFHCAFTSCVCVPAN